MLLLAGFRPSLKRKVRQSRLQVACIPPLCTGRGECECTTYARLRQRAAVPPWFVRRELACAICQYE